MENHHLTNSHNKQQFNRFFRKVIGISFLLTGILAILLSLNIIEYVDLRPNRIAIFNDPHTWEVFMLGVMCMSFGIANILSPSMKLIGKINNLVLLISFVAVFLGVLLKKAP